MPVLFLIAIVVVLVGIFFAATGRGGELSYEPADHAPLDLGPVTAADIALLRPPTAMWGYNMQVTDEALDQIARAMRERDVTIAYLQEQLAGYGHNVSFTEPPGAHSRQDPEAAGLAETNGTLESPDFLESHKAPEDSENPQFPQDPDTSQFPEDPEDPEVPQSRQDPAAAQPPEAPEPLELPGMYVPLETPEPLIAGPPAAAAATAAGPRRTMMILKASRAKPPEPHEATQPSQALQDPGDADDATEPSAVLRNDEEPGEEPGETTQPSATLAPNQASGPQGAFDTHGWWAEQKEAAREEQARRQASGEDSIAAAEEQGW